MTIAVGKMFGKGRVGKMLGAGAAVALSLGALSTAAASPALAAPASAQGCTVTNSLNSGNVQAKVDNCPGSGVSWGWIYVASGKQYTSGDMYVKLADGSTGHIGTTAGGSDSANWSSKIVSVNMCGEYWGTKWEYGQQIPWLYSTCSGYQNI
ncbi:hypothetical protein OG206_00810 [Streptomyces sp. NBC_01341]|uniref:hypothetical protein n=1 Tax=Streptomyces sp. NBC_01341 TaxID=2903831 RepID=UPI002E1496AC|nr:hypothetical protein OG206_00810 [Streptomyces sp. NBC_01341]